MEKLKNELLSGDVIEKDGVKYVSEKHIKAVLADREYEPEYVGENPSIGCRYAKCKCGTVVRSFENYCSHCSIALLWGNVHA